MNTVLVEYGIAEERSEWRVHVSGVGQCVWVYATERAREAISDGRYPLREARTGELVTARGYLVPMDAIKDCRRVRVPDDVWKQAAFCDGDSPSAKGAKAQRVVAWMIRNGRLVLPAEVTPIEDEELQRYGVDLIATLNVSIQVKCDWKAAPVAEGGSGNLFIQTQECNPRGAY